MANRFLSNIKINDAYTFPASDGTNGQFIATDGAGNLSFQSAGEAGATVIYKDLFTGNASTLAFTLANSVDNEVKTQVYFDGVYQSKENYTVSGSTITFSTAPPSGAAIEVITFATVAAADYNQKLNFYGKAVGTITKGDAVMFAGAQGDHFLITKATQAALAANHEYFLGLAAHDFSNNQYGYVTQFGRLEAMDTSDYTAGDILWFDSEGSTAGAVTITEPSAPNTKIQIAAVVRVHQNQGVIFVRPTVHHTLSEQQDVLVTSVADKDLLAWNTSTGVWENTKTLGNITTGNITTSGTVDGVDVSSFKSDYDTHNHDSRYYTETEVDTFLTNKTNWDTAYGWGDHSVVGYLTSFTETDPIYTASSWYTTTNNSTNWNTAYGWGDHSLAGYLTSFTETDPIYTGSSWYTTTNNSGNWDTAYTLLNSGHSAFYGLLYSTLSGDLNTYNLPGLYSAEYTGSTNRPLANNGHFIQISDAGGTDVKTQFYYSSGGAQLFTRLQWGDGGWRGWRELIHDANIGSQSVSYATSAGSAANAALLDSIDSSQFLRSDESDTMNGNLDITGRIKLGGYSYIGEDLSDNDSLTIAYDFTESLHFAQFDRGTSTYNTKMILNPSGYLGLGSPDPESALDVRRPFDSTKHALIAANTSKTINMGTYDTAIIQADDVTTLRIVEKNSGSDDQVMTLSIGDNKGRISTTGQPLQFYTNGSPTAFGYGGLDGSLVLSLETNQRAYFANNLGIGSSANSARLSVYGTANEWTGDFSANSTSGQSYGLVVRGGTNIDDYNFYALDASSNTPFFVIKGNGNVGIGTNSPVIALSVRKDVNDWIGQFKNYGDGAYGLTVDLSGSTGGQLGYALGVYTQGGTGMFVRNDGYTGIGTATPADKLEIYSSTYHKIRTFFEGSYTSGFKFSDYYGGVKYNAGIDTLNLFANHPNVGNITFETQSVNRATINSIGLNVNGNIGFTGDSNRYLYLPDVNQGTGSIYIQAGFGSATAGGAVRVYGHNATTYVGGDVEIGLSGKGDFMVNRYIGGSRLFTVRDSGNVGIGETNPVTKIDVKRAYSNATAVARFTNSNTNPPAQSAYDTMLVVQQDVPTIRIQEWDGTNDQDLALGVGDGYANITTTQPLRIYSGCNIRGNNYSGAGGNLGIFVATNGEVGIKTSSISYALDVSGTIRASGDVIAYSDARVKENVNTIDNALNKVVAMRGVEYNKIGETEQKIGVIAQEIEKILPQVVQEDENGFKSVAYGNIVGVLIEAIKELSNKVEELENKLNGNN